MSDTESWDDGAEAWEQHDLDGDGVVESLVQFSDGSLVLVTDSDGDGGLDALLYDSNGDGKPDLSILEQRDGSYLVSADIDRDGVFELQETLTRAQLEELFPGVAEQLDAQVGGSPAQVVPSDTRDPFTDPTATDPTAVADPTDLAPVVDDEAAQVPLVEDGQLAGDPTGDSEHWFEQATNGFCVPASIAQIVSEYTGVHHDDELAFVERANELHAFTVGPDGVPSMDIEGALRLLEDAGVPASIEVGQGVGTLVDYLAEGRRVMLAVDSGEIWQGEAIEDDTADHAIVITAIDTERGVAVLSDPGHPEGDMMEVPIDVLDDAWADSGYAAVVCDEPPSGATAAVVPAADAAVVVPAAAPGAEAPEGLVSDVTGGLPGLDVPEETSQIERVTSWVVQHPYVVLPIALGAAHLVARRAGDRAR